MTLATALTARLVITLNCLIAWTGRSKKSGGRIGGDWEGGGKVPAFASRVPRVGTPRTINAKQNYKSHPTTEVHPTRGFLSPLAFPAKWIKKKKKKKESLKVLPQRRGRPEDWIFIYFFFREYPPPPLRAFPKHSLARNGFRSRVFDCTVKFSPHILHLWLLINLPPSTPRLYLLGPHTNSPPSRHSSDRTGNTPHPPPPPRAAKAGSLCLRPG